MSEITLEGYAPKINMHRDHPATCLCCRHYASDYDADLSDVTPGMGDYFYCKQGVYAYISPDSQDQVMYLGLTCSLFEGK